MAQEPSSLNPRKTSLAKGQCEPDVPAQNQSKDIVEPERVTAVSNQYSSGWMLAVSIASLWLGCLLVAIDNTVIAVAVPRISTVFNALNDVGWFGSAYLLTVTALQPTFGLLYKYFHIKLIYLVSVVIFEVGSILCAAAPNAPAFILGRAIAGVGAAGLFQGALAVIGHVVRLEKRPLYVGIVISVFGLATCFGPILGGAFTTKVTWRWCFWINVPIGGVVCFLALVFLRLENTDNPNRRLPFKTKILHMDLLGAITLVAAICCLLLALQWGGTTLPWKSSKIIGLLIGFGILLIIFGALQWKFGEKATIPLRILRQRSILSGCCFTFLLNMSVYTLICYKLTYYLPFYFQAVQGVSATTSGIRFIPFAFPEVFATIAAGAIVTMTGYYARSLVPIMVLGVIVGAIGTGLLITISINTTTLHWAAYLVVSGLGIGFGIQLPYSAVQVVLNENDVPTGNAVTVLFSQLGGAVAIPIGETIFLNDLLREVFSRTNAIPAQAIITAGATNLNELTNNPDVLLDLRIAYSKAVVDTIYFALATTILPIVFAVSMEWKNVKKVSEQRAQNLEGPRGQLEKPDSSTPEVETTT
ncbi:hypothetical protein MMC20_007945 [Loxospora ochrophaea]|nr:hypothetical protein [Loxospora ochrophaea]